MDNETRILALAQDIYRTRQNRYNDVDGQDLTDFIDQTIGWVNDLIPEIEKKADWNFVRTNDASVGTVSNGTTVSYSLPFTVRKLVINHQRDLTIRQDGTVVARFRLVSPNQAYDPSDYDIRDRATVLKRKVIFSRPLRETETGGTIVADTIAYIPQLSRDDVSLLDLFDENPDIRQLFVLGVVKNQILPDIIQGGLTPSFARKFDSYLADCIRENDESSEADDQDRESFGHVAGVGWL